MAGMPPTWIDLSFCRKWRQKHNVLCEKTSEKWLIPEASHHTVIPRLLSYPSYRRLSGAIFARLVSAYFYCKANGHNALCGTEALDANTVDLATFAQHWSNFGLRQFALAYVQPDAVLTSKAIVAKYSDHPGWLLLKDHMDGLNHPEGTR